MPKITLPIDDTQFSVERPVVLDIIRDVMDLTRISSKTSINYFGDEQRAAQFNSTLEKNPVFMNKWNYDERVTIEVTEQYDSNAMLNTFIKQPENLYIFKDDDLRIFIKPIYSLNECRISLKYKARDKNQAIKWRNDIRTKVAMMRDISLHEIEYHYHLPEEFIVLIKEIHRLRENIAPYNESWDDYWANRLSSHTRMLSNLNGSQALWGVHEKQIRVQGYFDFEGAPDDSQKEGDHDNFSTDVTYIFKYQRPTECLIQYPIMVHNQLLDEKYRPVEVDYRLEDRNAVRTLSGRAFEIFESDHASRIIMGNDGVSLPYFDEFRAAHILPSSIRILSALVSITPEDKRNLFSLRDLGDLSIDSDILDFLANSEYSFLGKDFQSVLCLNLYRDSNIINSPKLIVNSNLEISTDTDLDLRSTYHVRLGIVTDTDYLTTEAILRLRKYRSAGSKIIKAINAAINSLSNHPDIGRNILNDRDLAIINGNTENADVALYTNSKAGRGSGMMFNQIFFVQAQPNT